MYIYVIAWSPRGPSKVGISSSVVARLDALQTGNPYRLRIYGALKMREAAQLEAEFHQSFSAIRLVGEWVKLAPRPCLAHVQQMAETREYRFVKWKPSPVELANRQAVLEGRRKRWVDITTVRELDEAAYYNVVAIRRS